MEAGARMKKLDKRIEGAVDAKFARLDAQEKHAVTGAIKAMYAATPEAETNIRLFYVDTLQRVEADYITASVRRFIHQLAAKVLERTEKLMSSESITEEALVRASVVKEMYARIKEKTHEQSK
jgi:hypothetical protein